MAEDGGEQELAFSGEKIEAGVGRERGFLEMGIVELGELGGWRGKGGILMGGEGVEEGI